MKDGYEIKEVFGRVVADVVYLVWRYGKTILTILLLWSVLHNAHNTFYYIVDVSEVALAIAVVENLDCLTFNKFVGETEVCHIWTTSWTIHCKETQACRRNVIEFAITYDWEITNDSDYCRRNVIEFAIGMSHKLIALLGGCIKRHWVVYFIVGRIRYFLVATINR